MGTVLALATPNRLRALAAQSQGLTSIALYDMGRTDLPGIGHTLPHAARALPALPTVRAWDFLSIALAVCAVDRFVLRQDGEDGWIRVVTLEVDLAEPDPWRAQADRLAATLRFLTGDVWALRFNTGGMPPPSFQPRLTDRDCVCLFSGGLDSLIGAMGLLAGKRRPLLVSQASRTEKSYQAYLADRLGLSGNRFAASMTEGGAEAYEPSSRARSLLFFAFGALASERLGGELYLPENGLISINPPLTPRRIGSLSTRTTHPHFISELQAVLDEVGLAVRLINPFSWSTKGEMLASCTHPLIAKLAPLSYSCGKGKRLNKQCGRCVPCLIRRASFLHAGVLDTTAYLAFDLSKHARNDDVWSARLACAQLEHRNTDRWALSAGPLPSETKLRAQYVDVVRRGLGELRAFVDTIPWL